MKIFLSVISAVCCIHSIVAVDPSDFYKLELVQVLFRHGDRIADIGEIYKTDPYAEIYKSYGYGQLTKIGHQREYKIGQLLRKLYGHFLGDFNNSDVYAYSTDVDRTKMSLQLVLAGLYPPTAKTSWSSEVNWLPIPTHYDPPEANFLRDSFFCPAYRKLYAQALLSPEVREKLEKYQGFYESLKRKTGTTIFTPFDVFLIYANLHAAASLGLPRPDWCTDEDLKNMEELTVISLQLLTHTLPMKRLTGGMMIQKFLDNINNENGKKIYLYGAHDVNVASFTNTHNFTGIPRIPDYGSTIILEKLRGRDNQVYIRMYLWTGVSEKLISLKLDNCERTCLLSDYTKIVKSLLPSDLAKECISENNLSRGRSSTRRMELPLLLSHLFAGKDLMPFKYKRTSVVSRT